MSVSLKCQYALRALFELARRKDLGLIRLQDVAEIQAIPQSFLENILSQLRQGGFVESRRGKQGGFTLARPASSITVAEIIRCIDGPVYSVDCAGENPVHKCPLKGHCVFLPLWEEAKQALERVYSEKSLHDLLQEQQKLDMHDYCI